MKSCLKHRAASQRPPCGARTVSFRGQDTDEVHPADEWDRSPVDVSAKLTYDDILELKQMQIDIRRACARAQQGTSNGDNAQRPFMSIPLPILPLLPSSSSSNSSSNSGTASANGSTPTTLSALSESCSSTSFSATGVACGLCSDCIRRARNSSYAMRTPPDTPPRTTIKSIPAPVRARNFTFLPLLESPPPPQTQSQPPLAVSRAPRWNACLDSDVDQSSDEDDNGNDGWPSDWPGARRRSSSRRAQAKVATTSSSSINIPQQQNQQQQKLGSRSSDLLQPATPPSPPAEADRPGSSYFAPVTFKANAQTISSATSSPTKSPITSSSSSSSSSHNLLSSASRSGRSPTRAVSPSPPKLPPLATTPFSLFAPNSPPSPPSPTTTSDGGSILDLRKCSLEATNDRPKPKQFKFVPLA